PTHLGRPPSVARQDTPVVAPPKVARRAVRKIVLTVRSATARRRAIDPLGGPGPGGPRASGGRPVTPHPLFGSGRARPVPNGDGRSKRKMLIGNGLRVRVGRWRARGGVGASWERAVPGDRGPRPD